MPLLFYRGSVGSVTDREEIPSQNDLQTPEPSPPVFNESSSGTDADMLFTAIIGSDPTEVSMADYLPGVVAGEMPASFEPDSLMAQAVAARTYILYRMGHACENHPDCDVCGDSACCKAYLDEHALREKWGDNYDINMKKITDACTNTDGQYLCFDGEPIQATFHSSSAGVTEDSANIWKAAPYLVSVDSPEDADDVPNYITTVEVSPGDFASTVCDIFPSADLSGDPSDWLGDMIRNGSGRVDAVTLGNTAVSGTALRDLFELRSTAFTLEYTGFSFLFTVTGYGHGVGMSQYGANVMASRGVAWQEILEHYYPGTYISSY